MKSSTLTVLIAAGGLLATIGYFEGRKYLTDEEVQRLCDRDGGIAVYEQVKLPNDHFDENGAVQFADRSRERPLGSAYEYEASTTHLKSGNPRIDRHEYTVTRTSDHKVLGRQILYGRVGGDVPSPSAPSRFLCPVRNQELRRHVFVPENPKGEVK